jgi:DNA polymerase III gamma/tau subunit
LEEVCLQELKLKLQDKYHPVNLEQVFGLTGLKKHFYNIETAKQHHAYFFNGSPGVGKTTMANIVGSLFDLDITEINAGVESGKEGMISLIQDLDKPTLFGKKRLLIIDECQSLSKQAQDALLKPLGDTKNKDSGTRGLKNDYVILCTTEKSKVRKALIDRCKVLTFPNLTDKEINDLLFYICEQENVEIDPNIWEAIIDNASGSARVAVKLLGEYIETGDSECILNYVGEDNPQIYEIYNSCWNKNINSIQLIQIVYNMGLEPETIRRALINMFNATLRKGTKGSSKCFSPLEALIEYGYLSDADKYAKLNIILRNIKNNL